MANFIEEITEVKGVWTLKVRIIGMWKQKNFKGREEIRMIMLDEKNSRIESTIPSYFVNKFSQMIKEYSIYKISKFSIEESSDKWKIIQHPYKIIFTYSTTVEQCNDASIFAIGTKFVEFETILSGQLCENTCVDVIGEVIEFNDITTFARESREIKKLEIKIEDQSKKVMSCTLWGIYADEMSSHIDGYKDDRVIVILQFFRVKIFRGEYTLQNGLFGSKFHFNQDLPEVVSFLESYSTTTEPGSLRAITHVSTTNSNSKEDTFFNPSFRNSLLEINDSLQVGYGVVLATIVDFDDKVNWYYNACKKCVHKLELEGDKFRCNTCRTLVSIPSPRYLIKIIVCDDGVNIAKFTLFDKFVQAFVGKSASTILDQHKDMEAFPDDLNFFLNKTFLFKIEINDRNLAYKGKSSYTVKDMTDDVNLIEDFKKHSSTLKDTISDACKEDNDSSVCSTDSATPRKRVYEIIDDDVEEARFQVSSTKLKAVKIEKLDD